MAQGEQAVQQERRAPEADRRRYNRRSVPAAVTPPYFEMFERIAHALEALAETAERIEKKATKAAPASPRTRPRSPSE
jgi:hypothetical protein